MFERRTRGLRAVLVAGAFLVAGSAGAQQDPLPLPPALPDVPPASGFPAEPMVPRPGGAEPPYAVPRVESRVLPSSPPFGPTAVMPEPNPEATVDAAVATEPQASRYKILLGPRSAQAVPRTSHFAGAEGGTIDVQMTDPESFSVLLSGATAATAYLGCPATASESVELVQEFEVAAGSRSARAVVLELESTLIGYLRARHRSSARVRVASATLAPVGGGGVPLLLSYPPQAVSGGAGRLCNLRLPPLRTPPLPLGRYVLSARLVVDSAAGGLLDAHSAADFSPDAVFPEPFLRQRDPFQGVAKKGFGLTVVVTATEPAPAPRGRPLSRGDISEAKPAGR